MKKHDCGNRKYVRCLWDNAIKIKEVMLLSVLALFLCTGCGDGTVVTIKIKGSIFSLKDSSAIKGAVVFAVSKTDGNVSDMAITGADGSYVIEIEEEREGRTSL